MRGMIDAMSLPNRPRPGRQGDACACDQAGRDQNRHQKRSDAPWPARPLPGPARGNRRTDPAVTGCPKQHNRREGLKEQSEMGFKIAIVGATGNVGREMLNILEERGFPADEVVALASRRSLGTEVSFGDKTLKVRDLAT